MIGISAATTAMISVLGGSRFLTMEAEGYVARTGTALGGVGGRWGLVRSRTVGALLLLLLLLLLKTVGVHFEDIRVADGGDPREEGWCNVRLGEGQGRGGAGGWGVLRAGRGREEVVGGKDGGLSSRGRGSPRGRGVPCHILNFVL